jgi:hypothetical protein
MGGRSNFESAVDHFDKIEELISTRGLFLTRPLRSGIGPSTFIPFNTRGPGDQGTRNLSLLNMIPWA